MVIGKSSNFSCAANFLRGRCIFCGSFKVLRTARGYAKCHGCGKTKSLARLRREITVLQGFYRYKKAGIMLTFLSAKATQQETLFNEPGGGQRSARLMVAMDEINREFGRNTLRAAASGIDNTWAVRSGNRSPCYTTWWSELPAVM